MNSQCSFSDAARQGGRPAMRSLSQDCQLGPEMSLQVGVLPQQVRYSFLKSIWGTWGNDNICYPVYSDYVIQDDFDFQITGRPQSYCRFSSTPTAVK